MTQELPATMRAIAADEFGGLDKLSLKTLPIPAVGPDDILIRVESAGVGVWDPFELSGGFAKMFGVEPEFPYVPGSDGAGKVAAVGSNVTRFKDGDPVYAFSEFNGKGFFAEYALVKAEGASPIPKTLTIDQAGAMPVDAITALRGLDDALQLKSGESVLIFGASGGIGHLAVQLAKRMGARVFAVASGKDGVALAESLGADMAVDGHAGEVAAEARQFASAGLDAALITAGGPAADKALKAVRSGGRVAYPHGVMPEPRPQPRLHTIPYDGVPDLRAIEKLNRLIESGPFQVHIAKSFPLAEAPAAERALESHHLGKMEVLPAQ